METCKKKLLESGAKAVPRTCQQCGFGVCPHYPHTPKLSPEQQNQSLQSQVTKLEAEVERLRKVADQAIECGELALIPDDFGYNRGDILTTGKYAWLASLHQELAQYLKESQC